MKRSHRSSRGRALCLRHGASLRLVKVRGKQC